MSSSQSSSCVCACVDIWVGCWLAGLSECDSHRHHEFTIMLSHHRRISVTITIVVVANHVHEPTRLEPQGAPRCPTLHGTWQTQCCQCRLRPTRTIYRGFCEDGRHQSYADSHFLRPCLSVSCNLSWLLRRWSASVLCSYADSHFLRP